MATFDENIVTNEVEPLMLDKKTISFALKMKPAKKNKFMEFFDPTSGVTVGIRDYAAGRGDLATYVSIVWGINDIILLDERAKMFYMPEPYTITKVWANHPIQDRNDPHYGLCRAFKAVITRSDINDKGEKMKNPWKITIINGYAKGIGTSMTDTTSVTAHVTDRDFLDRMETIRAFIDQYRLMIARESLRQNMDELDQIARRGTYQASYANEPYQPAPQAGADANASQPNAAPATAPAEPVGQDFTCAIVSPFTARDDGRAEAKCMIKGSTFPIIFAQMTQRLMDLQASGAAFTGTFYQTAEGTVCSAIK